MNLSRFDPHTLRVFLLAAQHSSLTKAAQETHLTLSAASKRISELEKQLNCSLFVRQPRGLALTSAGHSLVEHAQSVISAINRMATDMEDYAAGLRGQVRIWANTSSVIQFLPADLARFTRKNPAIRLNLEEKLSHEIISALTQEKIDIGIFADNVPSGQVQKSVYQCDRLVLLVPQFHVLSQSPPVYFRDVLEYDFVGLSDGSSLLVLMQEAALVAEKSLRLRVQVSSFDAICRMIEAGLGIGLLPRSSVRPEILGKGLHAVELLDSWSERTLWIGVRNEQALTPDAQRLFSFLKESRYASDLK
ncbi:LysR substrate-binding domain-containing protein [Advenella sp. RU8]|uniref:LysR substrate-binding domain-containing protein n=1 Tax=Advenella sp. RU8 TaxID=3399575 RepID=UPI003AACFC42